MSQLVVLKLGNGNCQEGFPTVIAQLWERDHRTLMQFTGGLPAAPELPKLYKRWQLMYAALYGGFRCDLRLEIHDVSITNVSEAEFRNLSQQLEEQINTWLNAEEFHNIERRVRTKLMPSEEISVIIEAEDDQVRRFPWHLWRLFEDYPLTEVALSSQEYEPVTTPDRESTGQVRVLGILGNSEGIEVEKDRALLEQLPEAETVFVVQPQRQELNHQLWDKQGWDILFFAGHSGSGADAKTGYISINQTDSLTISQLKHALGAAITRGLRLAIFNSCDGLGLARELADLHIPQLIVMREPVPDQVAQEFLKSFLTAFAGGKSLYLAVREARERLQGWEDNYPGASWLPVICQNPAVVPPTWQQLRDRNQFPSVSGSSSQAHGSQTSSEGQHMMRLAVAGGQASLPSTSPTPSDQKTKTFLRSHTSSYRPWHFFLIRSLWCDRVLLLKASVFAMALVMGLRWLGLLEGLELKAFDQLMRQRPYEMGDERLLIVKATPEDIKNQEQQPKHGASLSDHTLTRLFEKLQEYEPVTIGLDIYRDFPVDPAYPKLATYLGQKNLFGICKVKDAKAGDTEGISPPLEIRPDRIGFSDALPDQGGILRRHLLSLNSPDLTDKCTAKNNLSLLLALYYLHAKGIQWGYTSNQQLWIDTPHLDNGKTVVLKELNSYTGGYHRVDAAGRQILLNYRSRRSPEDIALKVNVGDILNDKIPPQRRSQLKGRIILVGIAGPINTSSDYWLTPYSASQSLSKKRTPGVMIQGHMVSQILSAVLDNRPLLWVWSESGEVLWIWGWSVVGSVIGLVIGFRSGQARDMDFLSGLVISTGVALGALYGICYLFILQGGWIPLVPSAMVLVLTSVGMVLVVRYTPCSNQM
ncbi:MAG: CHASE2 domain-containing protein [Moorea sp. SIOASIH]|uniref:CHASE2 domain-containing protein n=1 Tax=Moorena sp. SIOASIH TaxID=2607817 RepID=UPI0013BD4BCF|nr:CHASE2 domain-containing protein [Moorena sp. SIOASIH]NEO39854.1 CHASE2 domain-containing protein [Moorena sp. SIOASIH]